MAAHVASGIPHRDLIVQRAETKKIGEITPHTLHVGRQGRGDRLPIMFTPAKDELRVITVLAHPDGKKAHLNPEGLPTGVAEELLARNQSVILLDTFLMGELADEAAAKARNRRADSSPFTFDRRQERVQDLVTACAFAQTHGKGLTSWCAGAVARLCGRYSQRQPQMPLSPTAHNSTSGPTRR